PSVVMAKMQTTATRDSSRPYSTSEAPSSSRTNFVAARSLVMEFFPDSAERGDGQDANHGDKGQQQAVFDQGGTLFITDELGGGGEKLGHGTFSWSRL